MNTDNIFNIGRTNLARCKKQQRFVAVITLGLACMILPSVAFAQNSTPDPDPDVEAGSYISVTFDQDIVAAGDPVTGTSTVYEGDGDVDSDDAITATADSGYTATSNGTVSFSVPTTTPTNTSTSNGIAPFSASSAPSASTSAAGDVSVTGASADACKVTKVAHAVSVNAVLTPSDNFAGRSQTSYGVGEVVNLSYTTTPAGYESKIGTAAWSGQTQTSTGFINETGGIGTFTAGDVADSVTLTLSIKDGPLKGKSYSKDRSIVAPSGVTLRRTGSVIHDQGSASAGFYAFTYFTPTDVSFSNVQEEEEYTPAEEKAGKRGPMSVGTGSLTSEKGIPHESGGYHSGGTGNIALGCLIGMDTITADEGTGPFPGDGDFTWTIPRDYRVGANGTIHSAYTSLVHHEHQSKTDANGNSTTTISKGGITVSANQNDLSSH